MGIAKHVDWIGLSSLATELINYADNTIAPQLAKTKELRIQAVWEGDAADQAMEKYDKFLTDMESLVKGIKAYGQFLNATAEGYREQEIRTAQAFSDDFYGG